MAKHDGKPKRDDKPNKDQVQRAGKGTSKSASSASKVFKTAKDRSVSGSDLSQREPRKPKDDDWDPRKPERRKK